MEKNFGRFSPFLGVDQFHFKRLQNVIGFFNLDIINKYLGPANNNFKGQKIPFPDRFFRLFLMIFDFRDVLMNNI